VQCDLWEPRGLIPVGWGQSRRGWVVTAELWWSDNHAPVPMCGAAPMLCRQQR
jgi:hypothetical protein